MMSTQMEWTRSDRSLYIGGRTNDSLMKRCSNDGRMKVESTKLFLFMEALMIAEYITNVNCN